MGWGGEQLQHRSYPHYADQDVHTTVEIHGGREESCICVGAAFPVLKRPHPSSSQHVVLWPASLVTRRDLSRLVSFISSSTCLLSLAFSSLRISSLSTSSWCLSFLLFLDTLEASLFFCRLSAYFVPLFPRPPEGVLHGRLAGEGLGTPRSSSPESSLLCGLRAL